MSDRWLCFLAVALVLESAAGFTPWISAVDPPRWYLEIPAWVYYLWSILAGLLGILMVLKREAVFAVAVFTMIVVQLSGTIPRLLGLDPARGFTIFSYLQVPGMLLTSLGAPLLWRAAMALGQVPTDPRNGRLGKIGAGLALAGMACTLARQTPYLLSVARELPEFSTQSTGGYALGMSLLHLGERILLLWSSIEMLRRIPDEAVARQRMRRVHRMMIGWMTVVAVTLTVSDLWYFTLGEGSRLVPLQLWASAVYLSLTCVIVSTPRWVRVRLEGVAA